MSEIIKSATKLSLLSVIATLCILTAYGIIEAKDFVMVAMVIVSFYFKGNSTPNQPMQ